MRRLLLLLQYFILSIVCIISVFPLYYAFCKASGGNTDINLGFILPGPDFFNNIKFIIFDTPFLHAFGYTILYTFVQTILTLFVCSFAGYAFEIYHDNVKDKVFKIILATFMVPFAALLVPMFILFCKLGLVNTTIAIITPFIASPLIIMLFRQQSRSFPYELIEAARIDGLSEFKIFLKIYVPIMKPTFISATIITFLHAWNSYQWPRTIMVAQETVPMTVYLTMSGKGNPMTLVLLSMLPSIIIFFSLQKYFINGIQGSFK